MNAVEYLFGLEFHGHKFGLDNIRALTDAMGRPQDAFRVLHVAGTNGKGSVCAMADAALRAAGHRTGLYTSPHLIHLEERFQVNGAPLPTKDVADAIEHVRIIAERLQADGTMRALPTFFEVATATAFELFRRAGVEIAVLEVGLGGRLDATNVATPLVGVITNIALEHQQYLGDTLTAIATEKAGIIKPGMVVVSGERGTDAAAVIDETCQARGASLVSAFDGVHVASSCIGGVVRAAISTPRHDYPACVLGLRGRHQLDNAIVAVRALEALDDAGIVVPAAAVVHGLEHARWPGRLDVITLDDGRRLLLDAAHNPAGARTLASYLGEAHPGGVPLVIGAVKDKDHRAMLHELLPHATRVVVCEPPTPRAMPSTELAALVRAAAEAAPLRPGFLVDEVPDPMRAIALAFESAPLVCVAGSIFLVGGVLGAMGE